MGFLLASGLVDTTAMSRRSMRSCEKRNVSTAAGSPSPGISNLLHSAVTRQFLVSPSTCRRPVYSESPPDALQPCFPAPDSYDGVAAQNQRSLDDESAQVCADTFVHSRRRSDMLIVGGPRQPTGWPIVRRQLRRAKLWLWSHIWSSFVQCAVAARASSKSFCNSNGLA